LVKAIFLVLISTVLVACQAKNHQNASAGNPQQPQIISGEVNYYALRVKDLVEKNFDEPWKFAGKKCVLTLEQRPGEKVSSISIDGGDDAACKAALTAVSKATEDEYFPQKTSGVPTSIKLDFKF